MAVAQNSSWYWNVLIISPVSPKDFQKIFKRSYDTQGTIFVCSSANQESRLEHNLQGLDTKTTKAEIVIQC